MAEELEADDNAEEPAINRSGLVIENRFEILDLIGRGGMASVYRARHQQIDLNVAVKILDGDQLTKRDVARLKVEAQSLNSLFHPNIVKIYSFGLLESGEPYIVLDLLEGQTLQALIEKESLLPQLWLIEAFGQICSGLACAHESGIIHRDLKPANVMVVPPDEENSFIKILDFGIACAKNAKGDQRLTKKGEVFGSPLYMSPEAISGKEIDHRADIYAFGCLMYEAVTGAAPFIGNTVIVTHLKHLQEKPKPFAEAVEGLVISDELESIVFKCMEKDPEKRYQSAEEILVELKACNVDKG